MNPLYFSPEINIMDTFCLFLTGLFVAMSLMLTMAGGLLDYTHQDKLGKISKQHLWNDGIYLMLLAIFTIHFCKST